LAQTLLNIEIILVDDGSPDNCPGICDEYAKRDERIQVIHKQNGGLSDARNKGMEIATGEFIGFVDSDDWIDRAMYETLYENAKRCNADIAFCNYSRVIDGVVQPKAQAIDTGVLNIDDYDLLGCYHDHYFPDSVWACIFRAEFLKEYELAFFDNKFVLFEDTLFIYEAYLSAKTVFRTGEVLYYYLHRSGSLINNAEKSKRIIKKVTMFSKLYQYATQHKINKKSNPSKSMIIIFFWEDWMGTLISYNSQYGKDALLNIFMNIETKRFIKTVAISMMLGYANRYYSKQKKLSPKYRIHLMYVSGLLLRGKYSAFIDQYL